MLFTLTTVRVLNTKYDQTSRSDILTQASPMDCYHVEYLAWASAFGTHCLAWASAFGTHCLDPVVSLLFRDRARLALDFSSPLFRGRARIPLAAKTLQWVAVVLDRRSVFGAEVKRNPVGLLSFRLQHCVQDCVSLRVALETDRQRSWSCWQNHRCKLVLLLRHNPRLVKYESGCL